jgi:hypothetical protein
VAADVAETVAHADTPDNLTHEADALASAQSSESADSEDARNAGELAAKAVAGVLSVPHLGSDEVVQVLREYLIGLVEASSLKETLAAWAAKVTGQSGGPPDAGAEAVVPEPQRFEGAAEQAVLAAFTATPPADPLAANDAVRNLRSKGALEAAVGLMNQVRYLQEATGPCAGCAAPERGPRRAGANGEEIHVEP